MQIALERLGRVLEPRLVDASQLAVELELRSGIRFVAKLDFVGAGQPAEVVALTVDGTERLRRSEVLIVELEHALVALGGAVVLLLLVAPQLGDLHEKADLGGLVLLSRLLRLEDADELVPLAA